MIESLALVIVVLGGIVLFLVSVARIVRAYRHRKIKRFFVLGWSDQEVEHVQRDIDFDEPSKFAWEILFTIGVGLLGSIAAVYLALESLLE